MAFKRKKWNGELYLHCRSLEFIHPVKNELVRITAEPPEDLIWNGFLEVAEQPKI